MNVQLYAAGKLVYDSLLPEEANRSAMSIALDESINKGGTAKIVLPSSNPMSDIFQPFSVPVEIYRDGKLRWRGRPLMPAEDFYNSKTITCEGELCFLQDAIHRPYTYHADPATVFSRVVGVYNAAVEQWKRFTLGTVTVSNGGKNIALESRNPENVLEVIQTLVEMCGGYILFDSAPDGSRRINWYEDLPYTCTQPVKYGYNLTGYTRQSDVSEFATRIIPFGAPDEDGNRIKLDIDGKDYVQNDEAVALHGVIERSVIYNDVTTSAELEVRAKADVAVSGLIPSVIQLSAIDMSRQDLTMDPFMIGQRVPAESEQHKLSGMYSLIRLSEDLVNPSAGGITLIRELASLSGCVDRTLTGVIAVDRKGLLSSAINYADSAAAHAVAAQTQAQIFNKLTDGGKVKGIYMLDDGQMYINATYLATGTLDASLIKTGVITSNDGTMSIDLGGNRMVSTGKDSLTDIPVRMILQGSELAFERDANGDDSYEVDARLRAWGETTELRANNLLKVYGYVGSTFGSEDGPSTFTGATARLVGHSVKIVGLYDGVSMGSSDTPTEINGSTVSIKPGKTSLFAKPVSYGNTFTVPNTDKYDLFAIRLGLGGSTYDTVVLAYKVGNTIRGIGGWCGTTGNNAEPRQVYMVSCTFSGNTWTLQDAGVNDISTTGTISAGTRLELREVIGVI